MISAQIYILISIVILLIIALVVVFVRKDKRGKKLTPLASVSFAFVLAGICFGDNRFAGYSLMGAGVILAIIDAVLKSKSSK